MYKNTILFVSMIAVKWPQLNTICGTKLPINTTRVALEEA